MPSKLNLRLRLSELYINSLKPFVLCSLELSLTILLVISLFESPHTGNVSKQELQELQAASYLAWVPPINALALLYGAKLLGKYGPNPDNFDRNVMILKFVVWFYAFAALVLDDDMVIKRGPALTVSIIFCACDVLRFHMEAMRLIYDDEELEEEIDRLANLVVATLEHNDDEETAFKDAVREVIQRKREQSLSASLQNGAGETQNADGNSPFENHFCPEELHDHEVATNYGTL